MDAIKWIFSGIGVFALAMIGGAARWLWKRRSASTVSPPSPVDFTKPLSEKPAPTDNPAPPRFTRPTPEEMTTQVSSLPPFQLQAGLKAYEGLKVCWQALFLSIEEDLPAHEENPKAKKKWIVNLKHYDPDMHYSSSQIRCPGVDLDMYPQFKFLHRNELLIVSGKVALFAQYWVLLFPAQFEFSGQRIE